MSELLRFEYYRILKSRSIWIMTFLAALLPVTAVISMRILLPDTLGNYHVDHLRSTNIRYLTWFVISYFYVRLPWFIALFTPLFIGRDYKDGVIRNKLTAGHGRFEIFASAVITQGSVTVYLSAIYVLFGIISSAISKTGADINHGEMLLRAGVLLIALLSVSVLFTASSLCIKSRTLVMVIAVVFVMTFSAFSSLASNYSYSRRMIREYVDLYNSNSEEAADEGTSLYIEKAEVSDYINAGWYIGHPLYVFTNAGLEKDLIPGLASGIGAFLDENYMKYPDEVSRTSFAGSLLNAVLTGKYHMYGIVSDREMRRIDGLIISVGRAGAEYTVKSLMWTGVYFGAVYALFRKKDLF